jgi:hypothetical protein
MLFHDHKEAYQDAEVDQANEGEKSRLAHCYQCLARELPTPQSCDE